jgi:hypothetical protein
LLLTVPKFVAVAPLALRGVSEKAAVERGNDARQKERMRRGSVDDVGGGLAFGHVKVECR